MATAGVGVERKPLGQMVRGELALCTFAFNGYIDSGIRYFTAKGRNRAAFWLAYKTAGGLVRTRFHATGELAEFIENHLKPGQAVAVAGNPTRESGGIRGNGVRMRKTIEITDITPIFTL